MSYVDALVGAMESRLNSAEDALDTLEQEGPDFIRHLVDNYSPGPVPASMVPGWVKDKIADLLITTLLEGIEYARKSIAFQRGMVRSFGSPDALRAAADVINSQVNKASGDLAIQVRAEALKGMNPANWGGDAQYLYTQGFDGQNDAVGRVKEFGSGLEDVLRSMADAIESFYIELTIVVAGVVGAILGVVVAALTVATVVIAVLSIIAAVLAALAAIGGLIAMIVTLTQNNQNATAALETKLDPWPKTQFSI